MSALTNYYERTNGLIAGQILSEEGNQQPRTVRFLFETAEQANAYRQVLQGSQRIREIAELAEGADNQICFHPTEEGASLSIYDWINQIGAVIADPVKRRRIF